MSQLPKGLPPLPTSHLIASTRNKAGISTLQPCHPLRVQATSISLPDSCDSLLTVPCFYSYGCSPRRNWREPLEMYHIMLILYLNLPVTFHPTHCAKHFPQVSLPSTLMLLDLCCFRGFFCAFTKIHTQSHSFYFPKMR